MIAPGGSEPVKQSDFLVDGVVAYPGMKSVHTTSQSSMADVEQSSASESDSEKGEFWGWPLITLFTWTFSE